MNTQERYKDKTNEDLLKLYKETGSLEVKQEIVMRYIYLVKSIALQMRDIHVSFSQVDDIISEGVIAIMSSLDKFDMDKFISTVSENLDEAINKNLIAIDMKQSELTPRLYIKADGKTNTKFVVFGTDINSYSQGILCANNEVIKDLDIDMGDVEISNTRDIGYIINEENGYLTFKIANYNSQTSNNNQIAQIVDYSGIFKLMMIDFIKQFVR